MSGEYIERDLPGETLARLKVEYGESILARMHPDEWGGEPLSIDPLLAAAAKAGLDTDAVMQAVALPPILETCPWCRSDVDHHEGARCCSSDDCGWDEREHTLTRKDGEQARATAWIHTDHDDRSIGLGHRALPLPSQLPDPSDTLVLDATATPEKIAALFDVPTDEVVVSGGEDLELSNLRVTQVLDGQYHAGTIKDALEEERTLADRIQRAIHTPVTCITVRCSSQHGDPDETADARSMVPHPVHGERRVPERPRIPGTSRRRDPGRRISRISHRRWIDNGGDGD